MGGFAAKFRGFWAGRGRGEAIQRTADSAGHSGRKIFLKIFKKGAENLKIGVWKCRKGGLGTPHIGCAG